MRARIPFTASVGATLFLCAVGLALPASGLDEPVDRRITYQGQVEGQTGAAELVFRIFDSGGVVAWGPETHQVTLDSEGRFVTLIGSTGLDVCSRVAGVLDCAAGADGVADLDQVDADGLELEVTVDGVTLSPRQKLVPAFQAAKASSLDDGTVAPAALAASVLQSLVPTGAVLPFAGPATAVPAGWLPCHGQQLDQATYPDLFAVIGTAHGGDATTFYVPDFQGLFLRGVANGSSRDPDRDSRLPNSPGGNTGDAVGSVQSFAIQGHDHSISSHTHGTQGSSGSHNHTVVNGSDGGAMRITDTGSGTSFYWLETGVNGSPNDLLETTTNGGHGHITTSNAGAVQGVSSDSGFGTVQPSSESRPRNAYVNFIIRCGPADAC